MKISSKVYFKLTETHKFNIFIYSRTSIKKIITKIFYNNFLCLKGPNFLAVVDSNYIWLYLSYASFSNSAARLILSAVTSGTIFSTISFVSLRNRSSGRPTKVIVQSGVKAQMNEVIAPPKNTIPIAEAAKATILAAIANKSFGPGRKVFKSEMKVGETGATLV